MRGMMLLVVVAVFAAIVACKSKDGAMDGDAKMGGMKPPFGGAEDMQRASSLWSQMSGYKSWASYPGLDGWQDGKSPHGKVLRYYVNGAVTRSPSRPGAGSIIIKENYGKRGGPVMAITVMRKDPGYDSDNADWFWVKFAPDGSVMKNPKGMHLAGRVAKGMPKGCIACHSNAAGNDYLFIND